MFLPTRPSYLPLLHVNADAFLKMAGIADNLAVGVGVFGSAAAYALVWELGSKRLLSPGPKTMWSINRYGEKAILTKQAPLGYVGIYAQVAQDIFAEEVGHVKMDMADIDMSKLRLEVALDNAALRIARIMSDDAPVDSGDLRSQIMMIGTDESEYLEDDNSQGTMFL